MSPTAKILYTGKTRTTGGRSGSARSSDGRLDIRLSAPGTNGPGTNPEQLLGAGWSACFLSAIGKAAQGMNVVLPQDAAVETEIDLAHDAGGYFLQARLHVSIPGLERTTSQSLVDTAHQTCPYSKALRGSIGIETTVA
jgi:Ohr subfamily peroxiredoxin